MVRRIFYTGIFISWIIVMVILLSGHYGPDRSITSTAASIGFIPAELFEEQWMGVYYNGEKIGYSNRKTEKKDDGYKISELMKMKLNVMNIQKEVETVINAYLDPDLGLKSFDLSLRSDANMDIRGKIEGKNLRVSVDTFGIKSEQIIALKEKPFLNISMIPNILKEGLTPGKKISMMLVDPSTLSQENAFIEIIGKEKIMALGLKQDAFKFRVLFKSMEFFSWLTEKGEVLREESPMGFTLIRETKETAMQIGKPSLDLIAQVAVPFNIKLPQDTAYLKIRLSGIDLKGFELDGGRQSLKGDVLEIRKEAISYQLSAIGSKSQGEYLKDTMFIQSKDPQIVSLSKEIVGDEKDRLKSARLIYEWVYRNIEKVPTITIPTAIEVLKTKRGDCNEHTTLFTALSRAVGIPTRIAIGLTYKDGFFYYHAWPEIFVDRWIAIDPTLGQFPADASHIRIITGDMDKQIQIMSVIGKIKIEGLGYR